MGNQREKYVNIEVNVGKLMGHSNIYVRLEDGKEPMVVKKRFTEDRIDIEYEKSRYNNIIIDDGKAIGIYCSEEEYLKYKDIIDYIDRYSSEKRNEIRIYTY